MTEQPQKEYGKLTLDQFKDLVKNLPEIRKQTIQLSDLIREAPQTKLKDILDGHFQWAHAYEYTLVEQIALLFIALGKVETLIQVSKEHDPQQAFSDWMDSDPFDEIDLGDDEKLRKKQIVALTIALQRNVLSIMLYHRSLAALVEEVREGKKESFFLAVRVDLTVLTCPTFSSRLAEAVLKNDKAFLLHLKSAMKGPSKKHWENFKDLRYSIAVLRDVGFDQLSDAQLEDLFVHKLKLYPNVPSARKNLRKQMYEARKISTTLK